MAILSPSILAADFANLARDIRDIQDHGARWVHVDVMDGSFVPNISIGIPVVKAIRKVTDLPLDVHLMIDRPLRYAKAFVEAGADLLTVHLEADTPDNTLECLKTIRALGCRPGLALKPATTAQQAEPYLPYCDMVLVMTVEPGFGGQRFMDGQLPKLRMLRELLDKGNPGCHLQVDGGIDAVTHTLVKANGADVLVAGSAYFKAPDRGAFVELLQQDL